MDAVLLLKQIITLVADEPVTCRLVRDVLSRVHEYLLAVNEMETELLFADAEGPSYRELVQNLDRNRTSAHNALIDSINICNRQLRKVLGDAMPPGGIYPEPTHISTGNRRAIGDWAGRLVEELFANRR